MIGMSFYCGSVLFEWHRDASVSATHLGGGVISEIGPRADIGMEANTIVLPKQACERGSGR